jgi:REP element-mobilizing transposase RayT
MGQRLAREGAHMPRPPRIFVDGAIYHVFSRIGRGAPIFQERREAEALVAVLEGVKRRDAFTVFAWCVMSNHYHLALRTARVPLWRSMRLVQGRYAKGYNHRHETYGPVWQGRYKAKLVGDGAQLRQVVAYIHMNPARAGLVGDPSAYAMSGHRELVDPLGEGGLVDVEDALLLFGGTRNAGVRSYMSSLRTIARSPLPTESPEGLPWWRRSDDEATLEPRAVPRLDALGASTEPERPSLSADSLLFATANALDIGSDQLAGPRSGRDLTRARELMALLGVEQYRIPVNSLARRVSRSPSTVSRWVSAAGHRRSVDAAFRESFDEFAARIRSQEGRSPAPASEQSEFITGADTAFID